MKIKFEVIRDYRIEIPYKAHDSDVGLDLRWYPPQYPHIVHKVIYPNTTSVFECGVRMELPPGYFGMICSRSGLAAEGIFVVNAPGIIDPDYRGELKVILHNLTNSMYRTEAGMRIAQLVIIPITEYSIHFGNVSVDTDRGEAGFGSSGHE